MVHLFAERSVFAGNKKNNIKHLQELLDIFNEFTNPFNTKVPKDPLVNISFGKEDSELVEKISSQY